MPEINANEDMILSAKLSRTLEKVDIAQDNITLHKNDLSNPHEVTKTQIGLSNADNTADTDKPVSNATRTAVDEVLAEGKLYTDENDVKTISACKTYTDENDIKVTSACKTYADENDIKVTSACKTYADENDIKVTSACKTYTDEKMVETISACKTYTDTTLDKNLPVYAQIKFEIPAAIPEYASAKFHGIIIQKEAESEDAEKYMLYTKLTGYILANTSRMESAVFTPSQVPILGNPPSTRKFTQAGVEHRFLSSTTILELIDKYEYVNRLTPGDYDLIIAKRTYGYIPFDVEIVSYAPKP